MPLGIGCENNNPLQGAKPPEATKSHMPNNRLSPCRIPANLHIRLAAQPQTPCPIGNSTKFRSMRTSTDEVSISIEKNFNSQFGRVEKRFDNLEKWFRWAVLVALGFSLAASSVGAVCLQVSTNLYSCPKYQHGEQIVIKGQKSKS